LSVSRADLVFRSLADPTRRALFERLALGESTVTELTAHLGVSQPAVSQHLSRLKSARLVKERREGRFAFYRAEAAGLEPLFDWLAHYRAFWPPKLDALSRLLEEMHP
jgi:DNA-binding transcriptional ArsR family regulator